MNKLMNTLRGFAVLLLAAVVLTSFTGGVFADSRPDLIIAVNKLARGLEPARNTGNVDVRVTYSVFDTLIRRDFMSREAGGGAKLVPHVAKSWKRIDPKTLELKLRKGVRFHNGDELTSDDVVFTFSSARLSGKKAVIRRGLRYFGHLAKVVPVDKYTVRFITKKPDLILEQRLATYASWIVSKRAWIEAGKKVKKKKKPAATGAMAAKTKKKKKKKKKAGGPKWMKAALKYMRRHPVGSGPLKFVEWKVGDYQKFVAFDDYWGGKPPFKSVTFKLVPEVSTRIAGLVNGEFDIIVNVPPDQLQVLERYKKKITVRSIVLNNSHVLVYNTKHPVLKDKRIRQALGLAINRPALITALWQGKTYTPNGHQLKEFGPMYNPARKPPAYDPDKARALLKAAGYKGAPILYRAMADYYVHERAVAQIIQQMWKKVGVTMKLEVVESFKQKRKKDVGVYSWSNTYRLPDPTGALSILWGPRSSIQKKYKFWKAPKEFNDLDKQIWGSGDMKERAKKFQRMLDIFEEEAPMTILYNPFETYAMRKGIEWNPFPIYYMDLRNYNLKIAKKK